jgi:uncharacterized membrane protein
MSAPCQENQIFIIKLISICHLIFLWVNVKNVKSLINEEESKYKIIIIIIIIIIIVIVIIIINISVRSSGGFIKGERIFFEK